MPEDTNGLVTDIARGRRCAEERHDDKLSQLGRGARTHDEDLAELRQQLSSFQTQAGQLFQALGLTREEAFHRLPLDLAAPAVTLAMLDEVKRLQREAGTPRERTSEARTDAQAAPKSAATLLGEQLGEQLVESGKKALLNGLESLKTWGEKLQEDAKKKPGQR